MFVANKHFILSWNITLAECFLYLKNTSDFNHSKRFVVHLSEQKVDIL